MAKIRVYELARDLNMKNKALLEKIRELNISVRSHMSSLEDDAVAKIKAFIVGKKDDSGVDEERVKPTVIRRRKKKEASEPDQPLEATAPSPEETLAVAEAEEETAEDVEHAEEAEEAKEAAGTTEAAGKAASPEPIKPAEQEELVPAETETEAVPEQTAEPEITQPVEITEETETTAVTEPVSEAKAEPEPKPEETPEEKPETPPESEITQTEAPAEETAGIPEEVEAIEERLETKSAPAEVEVSEQPVPEEDLEPKQEETSSVSEAKPAEPEAEESQLEKEEEKPDKKTAKARKKAKKQKKETPAKIIKLPTPAQRIEQEAEEKAAQAEKPPVEAEAEIIDKEPVEKETPISDKKKKKWKKEEPKKAEEIKSEVRPPKKKSSFKRKEVVMGEDLYQTGQRGKKGRKAAKARTVQTAKPLITTPKAIKRRIKIDDTINISDLAKRMGIKANEMIAKLLSLGVMVTVNQTIDFETAVLVAAEFNYELEKASFEETEILRAENDEPEKMLLRAPVVTIMGHVDHGKTSLLDTIRKTKITENEAGGITQHIGAYYVETPNGQIAFLDTPGHEAFTAMRARGARVTDIVVLVVAADDGVMPQTVEAINHSKASDVPIIVAMNKIDKANADPEKVYRELSEHNLIPEEWGGDTIIVKVSAKQKEGIEELLEMILLQSEVLELKANPDKLARGYVVESKLDSGRGPVATILVQEGTLHSGDAIVCGVHHGKIRALINDMGVPVDSAGPSIPVEVLGLNGVPNAGDELVALPDEKRAKQVSMHRVQKQRSVELAKTSRMSLDKLFEKMKQGEVKDLNLIIKADVHGSIEALQDSLMKLSNEEVNINVVHAATGTVTETDVSLAAVSNAIIIGFNVRPPAKVHSLAQEENVDMRFYNIIYNVIKDIKDAILGMMSSTFEERLLGRAEIREVFHVPKVGAVAGSYVIDGKIPRGCLARIIRDGVVCFEGKLGSLRRFKDDVKEVASGYECGIGVENFNDVKVADIIECYYMEEIKPEL